MQKQALAAFEAAYFRLNMEQKKAVDTIDGPVMVIAGPGTGKTQILTLRIANILLKTDTHPENILALTFTESGARAMRERLTSYIGITAYRVPIYTFHEFAGRLIRSYPDVYERRVIGKPMTDLERILLIESILEMPSLRLLRPTGDPKYYVKPILGTIATMKREYITPMGLREIIANQERILMATSKIHEKGAHKGKVRGEYSDREKKLNRNKELLFVYEAYEAALKDGGQFDFEDMIFETIHVLEHNEDILQIVQEQYQYILADEHQDVNGGQNRMLELLASFHERPNIFVVGDEKQSIYRFQGASLENFLYFEEKFPHTTTIALTENYRSAQGILDFAHELIFDNESPAASLRVPLHAAWNEVAVIERRFFSHESIEHEWLVHHIQKLIAEGVALEEIAIIFRTNTEVATCAARIRTAGIPACASADGDILYHPLTSSIRTLIQAVVSQEDERPLFEVIGSGYCGITPPDFLRIARARSFERPLSAFIGDRIFLTKLGVEHIDRATHIASWLMEARARVHTEAPHRTLEFLLHASGLFEHAMKVYPAEAGRVIRRLYDEIEEMVREHRAVTLKDIEVLFNTQIAHGLELNAPYVQAGGYAVQVMTAHKSKGLEFEHVFIPHLVDSRWGGNIHTEKFDVPITHHLHQADFSRDEDEKKLLYVACTRAKKGLYLSNAKVNPEGRAFLPTRLLEEVSEELVAYIDTDEFEAHFDPLSALTPTLHENIFDPALFRDILRERGLSVSALNNYLRSPWNYFYRNLLRIPEMQTESAQFGTILHDTLEQVMRYRSADGELPTASLIKQFLERELKKLPITVHEYTRYHERGFEALMHYLEKVKQTFPHTTKEEYSLETFLQTGDPDFPEIRLTGKLDRLDFDAEGNLMRVVDYKTGKPKTRGFIEGTTKDSTGDYKRQLIFYALLLSLQEDDRLHTRNGLLSFVEADEQGRIHEEVYTITDAEILELKTEILRVVHDITHGAFVNAPCDPNRCDYCHLVSLMRNK